MGKKALHSLAIIVLIAASVLITQRLLTIGDPTHSDLLYLAVAPGVLLSALIVCLVLICWLLYSLFIVEKRHK